MAHHISELITEDNTADATAKKTTRERCAAAILELWAHRASLPGTSNPFLDLAPVIETLRALDPEAEHFFYRRMIQKAEGAASEGTTKWLNFAKDCDVIARMLIGIGIDEAYKSAGDSASRWADAASQAGLASDFDIEISDLLGTRLSDSIRTNEHRIRKLKVGIEKLEAFRAMASALCTDLQKQLEDLETVDLNKAVP